MASVPNMRLTALLPTGDPAATTDAVEGDIFARLLGATPALEPVPGLAMSGPPATAETPPDSDSEELHRDETVVDLALPSQAIDFLPLIEAQAATPVAANSAAPAPIDAKPPQLGSPAEATARPNPAAPSPPFAAAPDDSRLDPPAPIKTATAPAQEAKVVNTAVPDTNAATPKAEEVTEKAVPSPAQPRRAETDPAVRRPQRDRLAIAGAAASVRPDAAPVPASSTRPSREADVPTIPAGDRNSVQPSPHQAAAPAAPTGAAEAAIARISPAADVARVDPAPEPVLTQELDLASEGEWLDQLARDIARSREGDGPMRFRLHPQSLGHLRVELTQTDQGASVRLTAETEAARNILADAQPRLLAEARAQGVRIAETHIDFAGSGEHAGDPRRQGSGRQEEIVRTAHGSADEAMAPAEDRPTRADRYA